MTKTFATALLFGALLTGHAMAGDDCYFSNGAQNLYLLPATTDVAVSPNQGLSPYACSTSSAGTGVSGRMIHCSDGYEGSIVYNDDDSVTFRDAVWKPICEDDAVLDLMGN